MHTEEQCKSNSRVLIRNNGSRKQWKGNKPKKRNADLEFFSNGYIVQRISRCKSWLFIITRRDKQ